MSTPANKKTEFNFKNIFPICSEDYNKHSRNQSKENSTELMNSCSAITATLGFSQNHESFVPNCKDLIIYLDYIQSKPPLSDINARCKYFNYKLKQILNSQKYNKLGTKSAYTNMITITNSINHKKVPDICKNYVDDLDDSTFEILEALDNLYDYLKGQGNKCNFHSECYVKYMELSSKYVGVHNRSLRELLSNFKDEYIENREDVDTRNIPQVTSNQELPAVSHHTSGINARAIILVLLILSFTTLIIIFFLYKYTSYVSSLHSIASIIRKIRKRKNKKDIKLLNSFENDNEELINKSSQISYNPLQYF
ncbi:variable surface protein [Plasmodium gonderi]|uniref:Variable surface protein n=1 Tax=Plasmodium gonderi TaxID=77519 RepID=A0A1Y1JRZ3_PLAGO|nr:variable surface protein [Plasmodium gonderi]GAW83967.1 variable surface protein [Plasmodium gonderi]